MGYRHPNPQRVKINYSYPVDEAAARLDVHPHTVRNWLTGDLRPVDDCQPTLIQGRELRRFLVQRRRAAKSPCGPGQLYCVPCRAVRDPAGGIADYEPITPSSGRLVGICPSCDRMMYRRVRRTDLDNVKGNLTVKLPNAA